MLTVANRSECMFVSVALKLQYRSQTVELQHRFCAAIQRLVAPVLQLLFYYSGSARRCSTALFMHCSAIRCSSQLIKVEF